MDLTREEGEKGFVAAVIFFCFLLSGLSSLIYEVLWMRMLILIFGSTTFAISTVLTAFMGGLALGSYLFGRFIDRSKHPVPIYGALETAIGIYALLVPTIFSSLIPLYQRVWQTFHLSFYLFSLMQFFLVTLVLIIPTTLMGATLPILSKYYSNREDRLGWTIGSLYAINTLGGILGTFFSGFFLLPTLGVRMTTFLAASLNLLIGVIVLLLVKTGEVQEKVGLEVEKEASPENLRSILQTFHEIFPGLLVFQSSEYDLLILGSFGPLPIDLGKLQTRLSQPRVKEDLGRIQVKSVRDILAHFVFGTQEVPAFVKNAPINTDDNALLEFSAPKTLYIDTSEANFQALSKYSRGATIYLRH